MSDVLIFKLKNEPGYFDASDLSDRDINLVPEDTVCLSLENEDVTDQGIANLPELASLRCIDLDSTEITDKAMKIICRTSSLEEVWIEGTGITDVGFKILALLPELKFVSFWDSRISEDAIRYVKDFLPGLKLEGAHSKSLRPISG